MSNGDYYVGRPEYPVETTQTPEVKVNGEKKPVATPGVTQDNYYVGTPTDPQPPAVSKKVSSPQDPQPPAVIKKESGFFSKWFPCFAPNGVSE